MIKIAGGISIGAGYPVLGSLIDLAFNAPGYYLGRKGMINKPGGPGANLENEVTGEDVSWPEAYFKSLVIPGYIGYRFGRKALAREMLDAQKK